ATTKKTNLQRYEIGKRRNRRINKAQERQCEAFHLNKIWETHVLNVKVEYPLMWKTVNQDSLTSVSISEFGQITHFLCLSFLSCTLRIVCIFLPERDDVGINKSECL
uniref:Uncharacterized protein n=1 Tax=Chelonoidis abingdonii TaxID=106734 RepID=A0A8C0JBN5_CHEAB